MNKNVMVGQEGNDAVTGELPPMKRVNFQLSVENHKKLKIYAVHQNKTITDLLTEYVEQLPE